MFELPEMVTLSNQMNETMIGKTIKRGVLGNSPHKFLWYNRTHDEFEKLTKAKTVGRASVKGLLTQDQTIPGLGNAIAQDILFRAGLHPKHSVNDLNDEHDLYNNPGQYVRLMDKNALRHPCLQCGGKVEKLQYLGGACYVCPECQK